jgi:hypothetical protein
MADEQRGYGSRWPKYVLIYLAVAVVLYGLIYLLFFSGLFTGGGGAGGGGGGGY